MAAEVLFLHMTKSEIWNLCYNAAQLIKRSFVSSMTMLGMVTERHKNASYSPNPTALRTKFCIPRPSFLCRLLVTSSIFELSICFTCKQCQGKLPFMLYVSAISQTHAVSHPCWICVILAFVDILHDSVNLKLTT